MIAKLYKIFKHASKDKKLRIKKALGFCIDF
jgi:hypothetical protein